MARSIAPQYADGFQLPRSRMIGSSIYYGTKNMLYRFDAGGGELQESHDWAMDAQAPMTFLVRGGDLYVIRDLPMKDELLERQLVDYLMLLQQGNQYAPARNRVSCQ